MSIASLPRGIIDDAGCCIDFALQFVRNLNETALPPRLFDERKLLLQVLEETRCSLNGFRGDLAAAEESGER